MRIALIAPAQSVHTQRWATALAGRGHDVTILSPYREAFVESFVVGTSAQQGPVTRNRAAEAVSSGTGSGRAIARYDGPRIPWRTKVRTTNLNRVRIHDFPPGEPHPPLLRRLRATFHRYSTIRRLTLDLKPDLVHVHSVPEPWALPFLLGLTPLVISVWGSDIVARQNWLRRLSYGLLFRRVALVTATSEYLARVVAGYPFEPRAEVVPFGIDTDCFAPRPRPPVKTNGPVIGFVKHLELHYGPADLVRAFAQVCTRFPTARLIMAGDGPLRPGLRSLAAQLGLADAITFPGPIPHDAVPNLLASLDVFAMPSHHEAFGVAALEASAMELPVVATRVGGVPEVVQDGVTGLLVPPRDPSNLATALCRLIEDPELARKMGVAGREFVLSRYRWEDCVSRMETLYASI